MFWEIQKPGEKLKTILSPQKEQPGVDYVPSQFAVRVCVEGEEYAFHTLTRQLLKVSLPDRCRAGEGFAPLIRDYFLVPEGKDECAFYEGISAMMRAYYRRQGVQNFVVLPTFACNARCTYCYEEGFTATTMTPETVEQTLRFIRESCAEKSVGLRWFGGEPLLGVKTIDRICEGLRAADVSYRSSMVSNGRLITQEIVDKMTGPWNLKNIQISMDGAEPDYVARKRFVAPRDDYHAVMKNISLLSEAGISVVIRCNVDEENWPGFPRYLSDMAEGVEHKEHVSIYCSPLNHVRDSDRDAALWQKIIAARPLIEAAGFKASRHMEMGREFRVTHCMADAGNLVITPDGSLYACEHCPPEGRLGDIWQGITNKAAQESFCRADRTQEKCKKCPFLPECTSFSTCPVVDRNCRQMRMTYAEALVQRLVKEKGATAEAEETPNC